MSIAWIEQLTRKAWMEVHWTANQNSTVNLGGNPITVGGGKDDIRIKGLAENTLSIVITGGKILCTRHPANQTTELKDHSTIKLGKVRLTMHMELD